MTVLAGGIGSRFWPASTRERPKQLLPLASDRPLIVDTVERARALVPDDRIRILAGDHLAGPFRSVLGDLSQEVYWIEPRARGTAPVLAWAAWKLTRLDPDAVMVSLHADHLLRPLEAFTETVTTAVEIARRDELLLSLGVEPDRIETGYGHIEAGGALASAGAADGFRVRAFHEKPDPETARRYVDEGYLWNTGIFVWKASVLLEEIHAHAPEVAEYLPLLEEGDQAFFDAVPVSVIDRAVMERSERVGVVRATFAWDDVGSWEALARTREPDANGNVMLGPGALVDSEETIVFSEDDGSVVVFGARNLIVVRTRDTTMVMPRERAADLKSLLTKLEGGQTP
ncbi:MAG: mannose-1-phosphate guanylyltransferase [Gemmatimonadetes bacterium]|nr:mannose-1-phosphate guanylyltransferase [Gemmatimonadota bacterium]NNL29628.1 mannose-1-phosphate guanylyltransferase [Gemmatimonadota bacterium]